ncbi:MAG: leucine-rich repeat domain-containing protein [Clostridiales bacterium]|nr:leucine-rich repeat domain-containing protein [Clostridiales bacterium]
MKRKRLYALLLSVIMCLSVPIFAFAEASTEVVGSNENKESSTTESVNSGDGTEETQPDSDSNENAGIDSESNEGLNVLADGLTKETTSGDDNNSQEWAAEDFTYSDMEKTLYGCDYSRQFTITGKAVSGFSESGLAKLENNKNLVIPSQDTEGNTLVGVAQSAFKGMGLESVVFPTGMMVSYNDTITNRVTKRGNFIIGDSAFMNNNLTSVYLPAGVIATMSYAFAGNKLTNVTFPKTIWWIETMSFGNNQISQVNFPQTCDFQLEMHGMAFYNNNIKSVRLPDFTEVVNKYTFSMNPGMEECPSDAPAKEQALGGVVYMYTDNAELEYKDRIHTIAKQTENIKSWHQKLIVNDGTTETKNPDTSSWNISDFTVEGTVITGLTESGIAKRKINKNLVIPDKNASGQYITELASSTETYGLFGAEGEGFDSVELPNEVEKIGNKAFANNGLKDVTFPSSLVEIGMAAFQVNELSSVILPDTVTTLGAGAFATNPKLERISLSKKMTEVPSAAFGCSDAKNWMEGLTSINIPDNITKIGDRAFAGNNFSKIVIPATVTSIGAYAFSTKNYLKTPCTVTLNEGLETIGDNAFRNKIIDEIELPSTVKGLPKNVFRKEYSDDTVATVTKVYVGEVSQYEDKTAFPDSDYHKLYLTDATVWTADDFTYGEENKTIYPATNTSDIITEKVWAVTGLSESGVTKIETNKDLVIPATDPSGKQVTGIGNNAFYKKGIKTVKLPENVMTAYSGSWNESLTQRGNFFIGSSAFLGNDIETIDLPEGVISIEGNAFASNKLTNVKFPKTTMMIGAEAFSKNLISTLDFPEKTDFPLQLDNMAFAINTIESVQIPSNTEKMTKWVFFQNTGKEPVINGTTTEQKGGIVYVYKTDATGAYLDDTTKGTSNVQKLIIGTIPSTEAPWGITDFTYDEAGTTITGLSDSGKEKMAVNQKLVLPDNGPNGDAIVGIGIGTTSLGTFGVKPGTTAILPTSVVLPKKLEKIDNFAFAKSTISSINLPETLQSIGTSAFNSTALTEIKLPDSVTSLGLGCFASCTSLESLKLSKGLTTIPQSAFNMTAIKKVVIPEGVTTIDRMAFAGAHVEELVLPNTLETIGKQAFNNHQLTTLDIPSSVKVIGESAFQLIQEGYNKTLVSLTLHEGLTEIGKYAFRGSNLVSAEIPTTLTTLNRDAFMDSKNIVQLKTANEAQLEPTATFITEGSGHNVVYDKLAMTGWTADDFTYSENTITGWSASGQEKRLTLHTLVLPDKTPTGEDIIAIGASAFKIPDDEVTIMKFNVESPNGMESVSLPKNVALIGAKAFEYNSLTAIDLRDGLNTIDESAFHGNMLEAVSIPDSVTTLGKGAFTMNNIKQLKLSKNVTVIPQSAFSMNIWLESVEIPDTVTEIEQMAFAGARLTSLEIPASVRKIGIKAFHLHRLTELTIPGTVLEIGDSAFEGTYKAQTLKKLTLGEGIQSIGTFAFKEGLLTSVTLPTSLKTLGDEPFMNNAGSDSDHVVTLTTKNKAHLQFATAKTHKIVYDGPTDSGNAGTGSGSTTVNPSTPGTTSVSGSNANYGETGAAIKTVPVKKSATDKKTSKDSDLSKTGTPSASENGFNNSILSSLLYVLAGIAIGIALTLIVKGLKKEEE